MTCSYPSPFWLKTLVPRTFSLWHPRADALRQHPLLDAMSGQPMSIAEEMAALQARLAVLAMQKAQVDENAKKAAAWDAQPPNPKKGKAVAWELPPAETAFRNSGMVPAARPVEVKGGGGKARTRALSR